MKPAIIETVMSQLVTEGRDLSQNIARSEQELAWHRLVMGRFLVKARGQLPKRGTPSHGWGAFLEAIEMNEMTALRYIALAEATPLTITVMDSGKIPTYDELGLTKREGARPSDDVPPPADTDAPSSPARVSGEEAGYDAEPDVEIDRDTWCTPRWCTEAIGQFDLDPCSNERSTVNATTTMDLERGVDGLAHAEDVEPEWRVFLNPPYSDVPPWIAAYGHTRFCFLLKLDTSTRWFAELFARTQLILIPRKRVQFEPPPGVPPERAIAQQFPHALFYARAEDATPEIRALCWAWRVDSSTLNNPPEN